MKVNGCTCSDTVEKKTSLPLYSNNFDLKPRLCVNSELSINIAPRYNMYVQLCFT